MSAYIYNFVHMQLASISGAHMWYWADPAGPQNLQVSGTTFDHSCPMGIKSPVAGHALCNYMNILHNVVSVMK